MALVSLYALLVATPAASAYSCGTPLSTDHGLVKSQYSVWKGRYLKSMGSNMCCIRRPTNSDDCVSEGIGYGMLISAYLSDEATFQCLWSFAKSKFDANGLMNWQIDSSGNVIGSGAALDADEDMAMALLIGCKSFDASNLCTDGHSLITRLMLYEIDSPTSTPKAGDGWGGCNVTNPSYFAPGYYVRFQNVTGDTRWAAARTQLYRIVERVSQHTSTGLLPDWTDCGGTLGASAVSSFCKDSGRDFWFDAVRSPWRFSVAAAWNCDAKAQRQVEKMLAFFDRQGGASQIKTGYSLAGSGRPLGGNDQGCFLAMASTLYVHSADSGARSTFWAALTAADPSDYFCDALRMLALVFNTGLMTPTFHPPAPPSPPSPPPSPASFACSSGQCVPSSSGPFANATSCHVSCFTRYSCDHASQTCAASSYGAYAGKDACLSVCRTAACSNKPYAQCGGTTWKGATCCPSGFHCSGQGYYYQCVPKSLTTWDDADVDDTAAEEEAMRTRAAAFAPRHAEDAAIPRERRYQYQSATEL